MARRRWILVVATGGGLGFAPVASGTFGTLAGVPVALVVAAIARTSPTLAFVTFLALVALAVVVAGEAERLFDELDCGKIVVDEVAGFAATMLFLPADVPTLVGGFLLFRLFDVWKPWPASWCDRELGGGPGVVLDDVVSGIYANFALRAVRALLGL